MPITPDAVLDVVRALSTVASFTIVVQQLKTVYDAFFISCCERCRGTGMVTCPHCAGFKDLRSRPAFMRTRTLALVDPAKAHYRCYHCGPYTKYDLDPYAEDDSDMEEVALKIMDNLKAAVANQWPKPHEMPLYAGTVSCPECLGSPAVKRITPDFAKALGLDGPWDAAVRRRMGRSFMGRENQPRRRLLLEYPASRPNLDYPVKKKEGPELSKEERIRTNQLTPEDLEDYIVPYVSDDE